MDTPDEILARLGNTEFYREQSRVCRSLARVNATPAHRATFLRLAWHWRAVARACDVIVCERE